MPIAVRADFVTRPLIPLWGWWRMVEQMKRMGVFEKIIAITSIIGTVGICAGLAAGGLGWFAGNAATAQAVVEIKSQLSGLVTVQAANQLKDQIGNLSSLVSQLQADLRSVPRTGDLGVLDRHLSAQDGRMDSMDTRLRDIENRTSALQARMDLIDQASHAALGHR